MKLKSVVNFKIKSFTKNLVKNVEEDGENHVIAKVVKIEIFHEEII
jgi:hypothetical protein